MTETMSQSQRDALDFLLETMEDPGIPQHQRDDIYHFLTSPVPPSIVLRGVHQLSDLLPWHLLVGPPCTDVYDCARRSGPCMWQILYPHLLKDCRTEARRQVCEKLQADGSA